MAAKKENISSVEVTADNRPLCVRGNDIEYYDPVSNDYKKGYSVKYDGACFSPKKVLLQDRSDRMLLLSPNRKNTILTYDTETGSQLRDTDICFDAADGQAANLDDIISSNKYGELTHTPTLSVSGRSGNRIFNLLWDTREKAKKPLVVTDDDRIEIKGKGLTFTSMATTRDGQIAAGSSDGTVRLYSNISKKAKTALDQYAGTPIIGMDVSSDGEWILWTTKKFLVLACVGFQGSKERTNGFKTAMGGRKPDGLVVRLLDQDLNNMGISEDEVSFTPAKFDKSTSSNTPNTVEEQVVTTTGRFVVHWKLRQLVVDYNSKTREVNHQKSRPTIMKQDANVVDKVFAYDSSSTVVAALPEKISKLSLNL